MKEEKTGIQKKMKKLRGWGKGCSSQLSSLPASVQMQRGDSELMLSFDYCNIQTGRKAPTKARAEVNTQGLVSLEKFQL